MFKSLIVIICICFPMVRRVIISKIYHKIGKNFNHLADQCDFAMPIIKKYIYLSLCKGTTTPWLSVNGHPYTWFFA